MVWEKTWVQPTTIRRIVTNHKKHIRKEYHQNAELCPLHHAWSPRAELLLHTVNLTLRDNSALTLPVPIFGQVSRCPQL